MAHQVNLTVTEGHLKGQTFTFDSRTTRIIGRAKDCQPQIPDDENHRTISRYHCLLDINPPDIRVRDFGSKNGTFVNGKKIGQRQANQTPEEGAQLKFPEYDLKTGDQIKLSHSVFQVSIQVDRELEKTIKQPVFAPQVNPWEMLQNMLQNILQKAEAGESNLATMADYTLIKELGRGGFSLVYLARHKRTGEEVALKVMLPRVAANPRAINLFLREAENTKALRHPHVVELKEFGQSEGAFFFTMEYCNGGSIADLMAKTGALPVQEAVAFILQVLDGLTYAHNAEIPAVKLADGSYGKGRGLIHRDLKPGNIFLANVDGKRIAKIGDYGLSKAFDLAGLSGQTMSGDCMGTPCFMPRQQVLNFKYAQPEVDVWAAAASLYFMLTGYFPRNFANNQDPFVAVLQTDAVPIRDRLPSLPKELAKAIDLALVDNPEIAFKSARDFQEALLRARG